MWRAVFPPTPAAPSPALSSLLIFPNWTVSGWGGEGRPTVQPPGGWSEVSASRLGKDRGVPHPPSRSHGVSRELWGAWASCMEKNITDVVSFNTVPSGGQEKDPSVKYLPLKHENVSSDPSTHARAGVVVWLSKSGGKQEQADP